MPPRLIPMQIHAVLDYLTGCTLVAAPWYWLPHVLAGATEIEAAVTTRVR